MQEKKKNIKKLVFTGNGEKWEMICNFDTYTISQNRRIPIIKKFSSLTEMKKCINNYILNRAKEGIKIEGEI